MTLKNYAIVDKSEDGALYAVVSLEDGSTFGQWALPGTTEEIDAQIKDAVKRQAASPASQDMPVGAVRTMADIAATQSLVVSDAKSMSETGNPIPA